MSHYRAALAGELLKARRSRMPLLTLGVASAAGGVAGLFMFILADPARAQQMGLLNQKAHLSGLTADWPGLLSFLAQIVAVGYVMLFSFIGTWVFGREFADGTVRYLLALPVPRSTIVWAKFTVVAVWCGVTTAWLAAVVLGLGWALGLPGASVDVVGQGLSSTGVAAALMLLVTAPVATPVDDPTIHPQRPASPSTTAASRAVVTPRTRRGQAELSPADRGAGRGEQVAHRAVGELPNTHVPMNEKRITYPTATITRKQ